MRKIILLIIAITCSILAFDTQGQRSVVRVMKAPRLPKVKVAVPKVPKIPKVRPLSVNVGGLVKRTQRIKSKPIVPRARLEPLRLKPTYLFLNGLTQPQCDSIVNENNRSNRFLSHGIETRKVYRTICDSIDSLALRYDSMFNHVDSITSEEYEIIQANDSIFARYVEDCVNGFPEQMLMWSKLLCEVYPHVTSKVVRSKPIDFDEVAEKRREYFNADSLTFEQIYYGILTRMVYLNGSPDY